MSDVSNGTASAVALAPHRNGGGRAALIRALGTAADDPAPRPHPRAADDDGPHLCGEAVRDLLRTLLRE